MASSMRTLAYSSTWIPWESGRGYSKMRIDRTYRWCPKDHHVQPDAGYDQRIDWENGRFKLEDHEIQTAYRIPTSFPQVKALPDWPDLAAAVENALTRYARPRPESLRYVTYNLRDIRLRTTLGLPDTPLTINHEPLVNCEDGGRIHSSVVYLNYTESFTSMCKKSLGLRSFSILWYGDPIVWVVISPQHAARLEALVAQGVQELPRCGQSVHHASLIIPPSELTRWGIGFSMFVQLSGEVVKTEENAYYFTWTTGASLSETVNCCESDWSPPPPYGSRCTGNAWALEFPASANDAVREHRRSPPPNKPEIFSPQDCFPVQVDMLPFHGIDEMPYQEAGDHFPHVENHETIEDEHVTATELPVYYNSWPQPYFMDDAASAASRMMGPEVLHEQGSTVVLPICGDRPEGEDEDDQSSTRIRARIPSPISSFDHIPTDVLPFHSFPQTTVDMLDGDPNLGVLPRDLIGQQIFLGGRGDFGESGNHDLYLPSSPGFRVPLDTIAAGTKACQSTITAVDTSGSGTADVLSASLSPCPEDTPWGLENDVISLGYSWTTQPTGSELHGPYPTPPASTRATCTTESTSKSITPIQEIEALIAFGLRHRGRLLWKSYDVVDAKSILETFRPSRSLSDKAMLEILHILALGRSAMHIRHSNSLHHALIDTNQASQATILFPIRQGDHSFLVSVNGLDHVVTIHDNTPHEDVVSLLSTVNLVNDSWIFRYKTTLKVDGQNSDIVLLSEAEMLIRGEMEIIKDIDLLRLRYLRLFIGELLAEESSWDLFCSGDASTAALATLAYGTTTFQRQYPSLRDPSLDDLASAVGCVVVLHDFASMAQDLHLMPERETLTLAAVMRVFDHGEANRYLGGLPKDLCGLFVARSFRALVSRFRDALKENKKERKKLARRRPAQQTSSPGQIEHSNPPSGTPGVDAKSMAYDVLIKYCRQSQEDRSSLRKRLQAANYRGQPLMIFEDVCGLDYPMWMLLPMREVLCPENPHLLIQPEMYRSLDPREVEYLVRKVRFMKPRMWESLPRLVPAVGSLLGVKIDLENVQTFVDELVSVEGNTSPPTDSVNRARDA